MHHDNKKKISTTAALAMLAVVLLGGTLSLEAALKKKPNFIWGSCLGDNAVLQRGRPVPIWGEGRPGDAPGDAVTVAFQGREWTGTIGEDGRWRVDIGPLKPHAKDVAAGDVLTCTVGARKTELQNILVGDVWLCLGQSNMDRFLGRDEDYPALVDRDTRTYPNVRINGRPCVVPKDPKEVKHRFMSALPYHFGRHLFEQGDVPIGILQASRSGESIHGFLSPKRWQQFLDEQKPHMDNEYARAMMGSHPSTMYGALERFAPMAVTGVYWDQGEGSSMRFPMYYESLLDLFYAQLGELFEQPNLPFLMVQKVSLKPKLPADTALPAAMHYDAFNYALSGRSKGEWEYATIGECMRRWSLRDPERRVTVACHDMRDKIHYWGKTSHAKRAARAALAMTQGKDLPVRAPELTKSTIEDQAVRLHFSGGGLSPARWIVDEKISDDFAAEWAKLDQYMPGNDGVVVKWVSRSSDTKGFAYMDWTARVRKLDAAATLRGFAIAGADGLLWPATATIENDTVVVRNAEKVPGPQFVAYGLTVNGDCLDWNLYGANGLPVLPFWSGPWPPGEIPGGAHIKVFAAEPEGIVAGTQTTLRWEVSGVETVTIEPGIGEVPAKGERVISPKQATCFTLQVPLRWPPVPPVPGKRWVEYQGKRVPQKAFKPWRAWAVPAGLAKPVTSTAALEPGLVARYRERADDWQGAVIKKEVVGGPRVLYQIAKKVPEAGGRPVDIVFEGLIKIDASGLCRFDYVDHGKNLSKVDGNRAEVEIGGVTVLAGSTRDELAGACMIEAAGLYPIVVRVRCDDAANLVLEWTGPNGCDILDWKQAGLTPGLYSHPVLGE